MSYPSSRVTKKTTAIQTTAIQISAARWTAARTASSRGRFFGRRRIRLSAFMTGDRNPARAAVDTPKRGVISGPSALAPARVLMDAHAATTHEGGEAMEDPDRDEPEAA